jgi:hypothetical protein
MILLTKHDVLYLICCRETHACLQCCGALGRVCVCVCVCVCVWVMTYCTDKVGKKEFPFEVCRKLQLRTAPCTIVSDVDFTVLRPLRKPTSPSLISTHYPSTVWLRFQRIAHPPSTSRTVTKTGHQSHCQTDLLNSLVVSRLRRLFFLTMAVTISVVKTYLPAW